MEVLVLDKVCKTFDEVRAVDSISLQIESGMMFGLLGPNGAGKTTTIRMIMQIIIPDSGAIELFGKPNSTDLLDQVGYLPEERGLYRKMKVGHQLQFLGELKSLGGADLKKRIAQWLERFGMSDTIDMKVAELSKGNQQKIQFIATVLHQPKLIILDEPFSGLDPVNTHLLKDVMLGLKQSGCTIIFSTHQMEQVEQLCDAICLINKGKNVLNGRLAEVKKRFGKNTIRLEFDGENGFLEKLDYVTKVEVFGDHVDVHLADAGKSQELLRAAIQQHHIRHFEEVEPSLDDIFIETVQTR